MIIIKNNNNNNNNTPKNHSIDCCHLSVRWEARQTREGWKETEDEKENKGHEDRSFLNCCFSVCFYNYIDPTRHSLHFSTSTLCT